uniref:Uncharacterized protein n=1 Tax=Meleagris gallopavo TaxID=9103 RepID=A0A803XKP3_MELGA
MGPMAFAEVAVYFTLYGAVMLETPVANPDKRTIGYQYGGKRSFTRIVVMKGLAR